MSALGVLNNSCDSSIELLKDLDFPEKFQRHISSKSMNFAILRTYCIFCQRNKEWTDLDLIDFKPFIRRVVLSYLVLLYKTPAIQIQHLFLDIYFFNQAVFSS